MTLPSQPPTRDELLQHLVASRIAGDVATSRASNVANIRKMLDREPEYWFGVELRRDWTFEECVAVLAERVGIDPDAVRDTGVDRIDPRLCADALDAAAARIAAAAGSRARVLFATGHPTGTLALYLPIAASLARAGCEVLHTGDGTWVDVLGQQRRIRYVGGVATIGTGGDLLHTHAPEPMHAVLAAAAPRPDLVVADHGWAGAAAEAGIDTIGFADTNDPALFVAAAEGKLDVVVPLDDNVAPASYAPLSAYLLRHCR